jgi:hypothetical protein
MNQFTSCAAGFIQLALCFVVVIATQAAAASPPAPTNSKPILGTVDPAVVRYVKALILDDELAYLAGEKTQMTYSGLPRGPRLFQAAEIWRDFASNELAAAQKYGSATFAVSGRITGVKEDFEGKAYVEFSSSAGIIGDVRAYIPSSSREEATTYRRGQNLTMICLGGSMADQTPILTGCQSYEGLKAEAEHAANAAIENWIAGRSSPITEENPAATVIFRQAYDLGKRLPASSSCLAGTIDEECLQLMTDSKSPANVRHNP